MLDTNDQRTSEVKQSLTESIKKNTEERKDGAQRDERYRKSIIIL